MDPEIAPPKNLGVNTNQNSWLELPVYQTMTGYEASDPNTPVPIISPMTAIQFLRQIKYSSPAKNAPKTAPVNASGGIPSNNILRQAQTMAITSAYHGPINTAAVTFSTDDIGAIPSILKMGDKTKSSAIIIAKIVTFLMLTFESINKAPLKYVYFINVVFLHSILIKKVPIYIDRDSPVRLSSLAPALSGSGSWV